MTYRTINQAVLDRLAAQWTDGGGLLRTPVAQPNMEALATTTSWGTPLASAPPNAAWIRFALVGLNDKQVSNATTTGARLRVTGRLVFQVFVPKGTGTAAADTYVDQLRSIFQRKLLAGVQFRGADPPLSGQETKHWWQQNLWIPFYADEIRAAA